VLIQFNNCKVNYLLNKVSYKQLYRRQYCHLLSSSLDEVVIMCTDKLYTVKPGFFSFVYFIFNMLT